MNIFDELKLIGTYTGQYELINASILYNCNIIVYRNNKYDINDKNYTFSFETIINKIADIKISKGASCPWILTWTLRTLM